MSGRDLVFEFGFDEWSDVCLEWSWGICLESAYAFVDESAANAEWSIQPECKRTGLWRCQQYGINTGGVFAEWSDGRDEQCGMCGWYTSYECESDTFGS